MPVGLSRAGHDLYYEGIVFRSLIGGTIRDGIAACRGVHIDGFGGDLALFPCCIQLVFRPVYGNFSGLNRRAR